jgi:hypothetical protein
MNQIELIFDKFLGDYKRHNESECQISYDCPACAVDKCLPPGETDGKGNLEINYKKNVFNCWVCADKNSMKGGVPYLIKRYGNNKILSEYIEFLKLNEYDIHYKNIDKPINNIFLPKEYNRLPYKDRINAEGKSALEYLKNRGISLEIIKKFNIGFCLDGKYKRRIIIPSYDENNTLNYFISRDYSNKNKLKYLNPKADKEEIIFFENHIRWYSDIYIVEGVFDAIVMPNAIPLLGKYISDKLYNKLQEKAKGDIIIILDSDAHIDTINLYNKLNNHNLKGRIKYILLEDGYDISLINERYGKKGLIKMMKQLNNEYA